jgi:hypothetical protein
MVSMGTFSTQVIRDDAIFKLVYEL